MCLRLHIHIYLYFIKSFIFMDAFVLQVTTYSNHTDVCINSKFLQILWRPCQVILNGATLGICPEYLFFRIKGWMRVVCFRNSNPYHNNLHAADVLQTTHWFISQAGLKVMQLVIKYLQYSVDTFSSNFVQSWLSDLEIFSLLLSAIIHDFDHSGTTNNFHIQSGSRLTYLYNDKSVLENHHVSSFFQ